MARKLLLLINSLEGGGAEKVFTALAMHLAETGDWDLRLATLDDVPDAHLAPVGVPRTRLDCRGSLTRSITAVGNLIRQWRPDVVLSFLTRANCAALLARRQAGFRCVISERVHTTSHLGSGPRGRLLRMAVRGLYPRADAVIAVSDGVREVLTTSYRVALDRVTAIPNPVFAQALQDSAQSDPGIALPPDFFVAVGRLVPNKGGEVLLRAFAAHDNPKRALVILGEGPERDRLTALARSLGIAARVQMPGFVAAPERVVARATAYVSASRSEGFPNALIEAMALGRAVISTDCQSGPGEILDEAPSGQARAMQASRWGILVPVDDAAALTCAMDLLEDSVQRRNFEDRARARIRSYAPAEIFTRYDAVLTATARWNCEPGKLRAHPAQVR